MLKQKEIIAKKLAHLEKMRGYLAYSSGRMVNANIAAWEAGNCQDYGLSEIKRAAASA